MTKRAAGEDPFPWAETWLKAALRVRPARTTRVHQVMEHTINTLAGHTHAAYLGRMSAPKFTTLALGALFDGALRTYLLGAHSHDAGFAMDSTVRNKITQRVAQQVTWLTDLYETARELKTIDKAAASAWLGDNPLMAQRLSLYAGTLHGAHQQGELDGWVSVHQEEPVIAWHAQGDPPCVHCLARDGVEFTRDTLPDFPGDGQFGSFACVGGPNCSCFLTFASSGSMLGTTSFPTVDQIPGVPIP